MNGRPPEIPPHKLINSLRGYNLLPAIVFLPTRRKCDEAATEVAGDKSQKTDGEKFQRRQQIFEEFLAANPEIKKHKHAKILVNAGVASHHAGHIPAWKLLVEKMMSSGLLNAIFATSTVAAGVDFPARTVVIVNADTRGNDGWRPLSANELQQMTGRAGRRGKDNVGFVVLVPGQFQNPKKLAEQLKAQPDPLESRFRATYTTLLNLLDAFKNFEQLREIAEKSFAFRDTGRRIDGLRKGVAANRDRITGNLRNASVELTVDNVLGFERLTESRRRIHERLPETRIEFRYNWLAENVSPGMIVTQGRSGKRLLFILQMNGDAISAIRDDGQGTSFPLSRVNRVYATKYPVRERDIERAFFDVYENRNQPIEEPKPTANKDDADPAVELIDGLIGSFVANAEDRHDVYLQALWENTKEAGKIDRAVRDVDFLRDRIWLPFDRRARVLDHFGYLDFRSEIVTERGKWLADVRVDRPLLVGEALSREIFTDIEHSLMAGLMAALAADADRNYGELYLSDGLIDAVASLEEVIYDVSKTEWRFNIEPAEEINLTAAAAAERWTGGMAWDELVRKTGAEEGDLFRLLSRTGEALLQIAQLKDSNAGAARIARETAEIMLRDPIR
jgi:ATP-dependent RNA helicase HelY